MLKSLGKIVSNNPGKLIAVVIVLTIILGHYASQMQMQTDWKQYLPENDVTNAYFEVSEDFGDVEPFIIILEGEDALTQESMLDMLRSEWRAVNESDIQDALKVPELPQMSIQSVADFVARTMVSQILEVGELVPLERIQDALMSLGYNALITTIEGGEIEIEAFNVTFESPGLNDSGVKNVVYEILTNPSVPSNQRKSMHSMLSKDYQTTPNGTAKAIMMVFMLNTSSRSGESTDEMTGRLADIEFRIIDIVNEETSLKVSAIGMGIMTERISEVADQTMGELLPISVVFVFIILLITFRTITDTLLSLAALGISLIWMFGIGVLLGLMFNEMIIMAPILVIGLGIDYGIHVLLRYREEGQTNIPRRAVMRTIAGLGIALLLVTVTTTVAFMSNVTSPMILMAHFGILVTIGIISCFFVMLVFLLGSRQFIDMHCPNNKRSHKKKGESGIRTLDRFLAVGALGAEHHPVPVIIVLMIVTIPALFGAINLETEFNQDDFLPDGTDIKESMHFLNDNFNNTMMDFSLILIKGNISDPAVLKAMNETIENMADDQYVVKPEGNASVECILTLMRFATDMNFSSNLTEADTDGDGIPDTNITDLFDELFRVSPEAPFFLHRVNGENGWEYDGAVIRVYTSSDKLTEHERLYDELKADVQPLKERMGLEVTITGVPILIYTVTTALQVSQMRSIAFTIIASGIILTVIFFFTRRSLMLGMITMFPVILVLIWIFGFMYYMGMTLNALTTTIGALAIGLGITYSIHMTQRFLEDLDRSGSVEATVRRAVQHTGTALFGAAATTIGAFGVLTLSSMPPMGQFGTIMSLSILLSFGASVFVLPTFLVMWARWGNGKVAGVKRPRSHLKLKNNKRKGRSGQNPKERHQQSKNKMVKSKNRERGE